MHDLIRREDLNISLCNLAAERMFNKSYIKKMLPECDVDSAAKGYALAMGEFSALVNSAPSVKGGNGE